MGGFLESEIFSVISFFLSSNFLIFYLACSNLDQMYCIVVINSSLNIIIATNFW